MSETMRELFGPNFAYGYLFVGVIIGFVVGRITAPKAAARNIGGERAGAAISGGPAVAAPRASVDLEIGGRSIGIDPEALAEIRQLSGQGRKIEAVKRLREATGLDLAESKELVEAIEQMKR